MDQEYVEIFLKSNLQPFSKKYLATRLLILWVLSLPCSLLTDASLPIFVLFICVNVCILVITSVFWNEKYYPVNQFFLDGIFFSYLSFLLIFVSFFLVTFQKEKEYWVFGMMLILSLFSIILMTLINIRKIRQGKVQYQKYQEKSNLLIILASATGCFLARALLSKVDQDISTLIVSTLFYLVAIILNTGCVGFLKVYLLLKSKDIFRFR